MTGTIKVRYVSVWKLRGGSKLVTDKDNLLLARLNNPRIEAHVTTDPEPYFHHIDQSAAIGTLFLKGLFAENKKGSATTCSTHSRRRKIYRRMQFNQY